VRVLAATNRNLAEEVAAGRFRADLYHRLSVYPIHVPPLRERREDVALLAGFFLDAVRARLGLGQVRLAPAARALLERYDWPGNVRELEHVLMRAALRASQGRRHATVVIEPEHLDLVAGRSPAPEPPAAPTAAPDIDLGLSLRAAVDEFQRRRIAAVVARSGGNWAEAARVLGMGRGNLHRLAKRLGL